MSNNNETLKKNHPEIYESLSGLVDQLCEQAPDLGEGTVLSIVVTSDCASAVLHMDGATYEFTSTTPSARS